MSRAVPKCSSLHPIMCPMPHGSYTPLSKKWSSVDSSWGVSHLGTRAEGSLRALRGVWTRCSFLWILSLGSCLLLCSVLPWDCGDGPVTGWWLLGLYCWFVELNASVTSSLSGGWGGGKENTISMQHFGKEALSTWADWLIPPSDFVFLSCR